VHVPSWLDTKQHCRHCILHRRRRRLVAWWRKTCHSDVGVSGKSSGQRSMLTPAEELGLSGLSLASRVRKAFYKIPETELIDLMQRISQEATRRHLIYLRDGELDTIRVQIGRAHV